MDKNTALILIDIQKGFDDIDYWGGNRNNPDAEKNAGKILDVWRQYKMPVFHVKHCSINPNSPLSERNPGNDIKDIVRPIGNEPVIKKNVNSAFIGTNLKQLLDEHGIHSVVVLGLTTDHCVSTTVRMAANYHYNTFIVADATATFDKTGMKEEKFDAELIHQTALASLKDEFAVVITTGELLDRVREINGAVLLA